MVVARIVVPEWERVLRYRNDRPVEALGAGVHRRGRWRARLVRVDLRSSLVVVAGQELLTADGLSVRVSVQARVRVEDPQRHVEVAADPYQLLHAAVQIALRDVVAARTLDELLAQRSQLGAEVGVDVSSTAAELGVVLTDMAVRDVVIPVELRRAAAELASARAQGLAVLERARSEVAATRALANAARMVADNPALLKLRTLQAVERGGATVVLTAGQG